MKKSLLLIFVSLCTTYMSAQEQINLLDITSGKYSPKGIQGMTSSADGESYYQANKDNTMIVKYAYKTGLPTDTVFNVKKARECPFDSFQGFMIAPDDKRILLFNDYEPIFRRSFKATYYYFDMRRNLVQKLTTNKDKQSVPTWSHDGRMLAYVIDNNIWLAKFDYDSESQVTKDGEPGKIINGATDWVYEEEFGTTSIMDFSADNRLLAFLKTDETNVPEFSFQKYDNQLYPELFSFKYPKAGLPNSKVSVNVFDIEAKTTRKMDIPKCEYIPQLQFLPTGDNMAVITLNREQNDLNIYLTNGRSSVSKLLLNEKNDSYVDFELARSLQFMGDQFVYLSEKDGYSHIYLYSNTGVLDRQLTSGNFDVTAILAVDPTTNTVFYEAADESPLRRNVYKMDLKKAKNGTTKLSPKSGYNTAQFSNNGKYFVNYFTNATTPIYITMNDASGKELRVLESNDALKKRASQVGVMPKEFITVKAADGATDLNAYLMKPTNFNPSKKYPLVMVQYSGPNSQMVEDKFMVDWTDYLVSQGFIVACVDGRGTGARGEDFRKSTYMNLGIKESDDQIAAAKYFGTLPYIDKDKIAIWGWSYGGYNTLMSMSRGNTFAAGVAVAPVTDWRYYDTVYAERFMRTPQQNASGFDNGSPIKLANQLNGNLLLVHGSADDNVHFQNSLEYANALVNANKQFDMFVFTDKDHSIRGAANRAYLYNKIIKYLQTNM